jgi:hypothetical protein
MPSPEAIQDAKRTAAKMGYIKIVPTKPADLDAPGCRLRQGIVYWMPQQDIVNRGYQPTSARLWAASPGNAEPTPEQWHHISKECGRLQREMLSWRRTSAMNFDAKDSADDAVFTFDPAPYEFPNPASIP